MKIHLNRLIERLNIKLSRLKEKQKLKKKQLVFWWNKSSEKMNQEEQIEILDFNEPVKYEKKKRKIKLPKIRNKVQFASIIFAMVWFLMT